MLGTQRIQSDRGAGDQAFNKNGTQYSSSFLFQLKDGRGIFLHLAYAYALNL